MELMAIHNFHFYPSSGQWHADLHVEGKKIGRVLSPDIFEGDESLLPAYPWPEIDQLIQARELTARLQKNVLYTRLGRKGVYQTRPPEADQILNNLPFDEALAIWSAQA